MSVRACPDCGGAIFFGAKRCSNCRPAKRLDRLEVAVAAGLLGAILIGGIYIGVLLARDPNRPSLEAAVSAVSRLFRADNPPEAKDDYGWIARGMQACRQDAARQPERLHFLVVPLMSANRNDVRSATISSATAANAELLSLDDTLAGLRKGDLRLYPGEYVFGISSVPDNVIYKWGKASGASRFSTDEAEQIPAYRMAFQIGENAGDVASGTEFRRGLGNCQWTGALIAG
jgi:hypothetical protein